MKDTTFDLFRKHFTMNVSDQDLKHFKSLLLNDKFEEAKKILVQNKCDFKKELEVKTSSALKDLPRDDLATFLIPDDVTRPGGQRLFALKATPNGDCLFNAISLLVRGNESAAMLLRLLVAGELYFNASFYADHHVFVDTIRSNSDLSLDTLFTVALTEAGADECSKNRSKTDAVKSEALVACTRGEWSSFLHILLDFDIVDTINPYPIPHNCLARPRLSSGLELKQTWQMCFFVQS